MKFTNAIYVLSIMENTVLWFTFTNCDLDERVVSLALIPHLLTSIYFDLLLSKVINVIGFYLLIFVFNWNS